MQVLEMQEQMRGLYESKERVNKEIKTMSESLEAMITTKIDRLKEALLIVIEGQKKINEQLTNQKTEHDESMERMLNAKQKSRSSALKT